MHPRAFEGLLGGEEVIDFTGGRGIADGKARLAAEAKAIAAAAEAAKAALKACKGWRCRK